MCAAASSIISSRNRHVSANDDPAGAMSMSWNEKNGAPSFDTNSNAAAIFIFAASIGSIAWSPVRDDRFHGRSNVPDPKMSEPSHAKLCQ